MGLLLTARVLELAESKTKFDADVMLPDYAKYAHVEQVLAASSSPVNVGSLLGTIGLVAIHTSGPIQVILDGSIERTSIERLYFAAGVNARSLEIVAPTGADVSILLGGA